MHSLVEENFLSSSETIHLFDYTFLIKTLSREIRPKTQFVSTFLFLRLLAEAMSGRYASAFMYACRPRLSTVRMTIIVPTIVEI